MLHDFWQGGIYLFELFENYGTSPASLLISGIAELIGVSYVLGIDDLWNKFEEMLGFRPFSYMKFMNKFGIPLILIIILGLSIANWTPVTYLGYEFPWWAHTFGWFLTITVIMWIPLYPIILIHVTPSDPKGIFNVRYKLTETFRYVTIISYILCV